MSWLTRLFKPYVADPSPSRDDGPPPVQLPGPPELTRDLISRCRKLLQENAKLNAQVDSLTEDCRGYSEEGFQTREALRTAQDQRDELERKYQEVSGNLVRTTQTNATKQLEFDEERIRWDEVDKDRVDQIAKLKREKETIEKETQDAFKVFRTFISNMEVLVVELKVGFGEDASRPQPPGSRDLMQRVEDYWDRVCVAKIRSINEEHNKVVNFLNARIKELEAVRDDSPHDYRGHLGGLE